MRIIADLHTHSRYARAVSKQMNLEMLALWGEKKGVTLIAAPDCTHPAWLGEMKEKLSEDSSGFLKLKDSDSPIRFVLSTEIACIFSRGGKVRRIHMMIIVPSFAVAEKINTQLALRGNLRTDGRPMIGMDVKDLVHIALAASPDCIVFPAHVWTPWFGMYGSKSGFNSMEECFEELFPYIPSVETGLSSDPAMNWRMKELDTKTILSFSDAHSAPNLGREATVFELSEPTITNLAKALRIPFPTTKDRDRIEMTLEFFPEEGMYHWDGHRAHNIRWSPEETRKHNSICPVCKRAVTVGVMNRVEQIADRDTHYRDPKRPSFTHLVPLAEIISQAIHVGKQSKAVSAEYNAILQATGSEFTALLETPVQELWAISTERIAKSIGRMRNGEVKITPGYDGVYGSVEL